MDADGASLLYAMFCDYAAEQVVSMLRFVVREAQNLMMRRKQARDSSSSSGTDRRESDTSDTSRNDQVRKPASADANGSATPMDTGSSSDDGSSNNSSCLNNNSEGSKHAGASSSKSKKQSGKPSDVPPGDTSLTDVQLLLAIQQLADSKLGTQQLVLQQVTME